MPLFPAIRRTLAPALVGAVLALPAHVAVAQTAHAYSGDRDAQILGSYRLTDAGLRKFYRAMENIATAAAKDTSLQNAADDDADNEDIAAMAARYDRVPALKRAVAAAGLTSTEMVTFTLSFMQASLANSLLQGPEGHRLQQLPKGTPKENVDFVHAHQDEIKRLDAELKTLQKSLGEAEADSSE